MIVLLKVILWRSFISTLFATIFWNHKNYHDSILLVHQRNINKLRALKYFTIMWKKVKSKMFISRHISKPSNFIDSIYHLTFCAAVSWCGVRCFIIYNSLQIWDQYIAHKTISVASVQWQCSAMPVYRLSLSSPLAKLVKRPSKSLTWN